MLAILELGQQGSQHVGVDVLLTKSTAHHPLLCDAVMYQQPYQWAMYRSEVRTRNIHMCMCVALPAHRIVTAVMVQHRCYTGQTSKLATSSLHGWLHL